MKTAVYFFICSILAGAMPCAAASEGMTPDKALQRLMQGNARYVKDQLEHPDRNQERREAIVAKQKPFATVLGCADSRVSPEIVFDQGIGDVFVVRVAGNVVGPIELDSLEYSVIYLGASLILVLGHEGCGAVNAVVEGNTKDIEAVASLIEPAVAKVKGNPGDILENAIKANVLNIVNQLKASPVIGELVRKGKVDVKGGYYNLRSGKVDLL